MDYRKIIENYIENSIKTKREVMKNIDMVEKIAKEIVKAYKNGNKVIWFGNGGSAADAQHLAGELVGKFYMDRKPLRSISLTTNTSQLTAISNDYNFNTVFSRQVEALVDPGDVVIGISTSGNSMNVVEGIKKASEKGAITVGFTGKTGGKLKDEVDYLLTVPSDSTPHIQESHIMLGHIICYLVEKELFEN